MITPTPRAMSPQDIVRIYVPPAPPDEQQHTQQKFQPITANEGRYVTKEVQPNSLPLLSDSSSVRSISSNMNMNNSQETPKQHFSLEFPCTESNNRNSIIYGSGELTPVHYSFHRSDEELVKSFSESISGHSLSHISNVGGVGAIVATAGGQRSTSSSRRGSLSRKSPLAMFESNTLMECSHILAKRRLSTQSNGLNTDNRIKLSIGNSSSENISNLGQPTSLSLLRRNSLSNGESTKIMTSFEQLATYRNQTATDGVDRGESPIRIISSKRHEVVSPDDEENYTYSYYNSYKSAESRQRKNPAVIGNDTKKYVSESNIQYKSFTTATDSVVESDIEYTALNKRRPHSSAIETSPFQFADTVAMPTSRTATSIKEYKRFYSTSIDDDDPDPDKNNDAEEDEPIKSSDDSSSSPVTKSVPITPVNETIPLLQSSPISAQNKSQISSHIYHASHTSTSNSVSPAPSQFKLKSPSHIPVAMLPSAKGKSSTPSPDMASPPMVRPSRIPLVYNNQKILSATVTSPVMHSSSSASSINSPNDLNRILPPVEISAGSRSNNEIHGQLMSPLSGVNNSKILSASATPNGTPFDFDGKRATKRIGTSSTTTTTTTTTATNAIRIQVNTNDQN